MSTSSSNSISLGDRQAGATIALFFAVPTVALVWFVLNLELSFVGHFLSSVCFWVTAVCSIIIGFLAPNLLIELLGRLWHLLHGLARWWS